MDFQNKNIVIDKETFKIDEWTETLQILAILKLNEAFFK